MLIREADANQVRSLILAFELLEVFCNSEFTLGDKTVIMKKNVLLASAIALGGGLVYLLTRDFKRSQRSANNDDQLKSSERTGDAESLAEEENHVVDDRGTDQFAAADILRQIRDAGFDASDEKLALALGRPAEEIEAWTSGSGHIDADVILKARNLARQRGIAAS